MDERTKNVPRSRHQRFKTKTPHGSCCFMCGYQDVLNAIYDSLVCFGSRKAFVSCKENHYPNSLYSQGSFANPFVLVLRPQRCLARKPCYNNLFRGPFAVKGESLWVTWKRYRQIKSGIQCNVFAHRLFTHFIRPSEEQEKKRKRREEVERREEKDRFSPEKMWLGAWRLCRETSRLGPLHLSRPFRDFFAVLSGNSGAHLPISCRQSSTGAPSYPKIHKHRPTCHEEKTKS